MKQYLSITLLLLTFAACKKLDVPPDTPLCIKNKIRKMERNPVWNPPAEVWQYTYNGDIVYYFTSRCCDIPSDLYDSKCNIICHPDGGFTGVGDGNCTDFTANNGVLIWRDER